MKGAMKTILAILALLFASAVQAAEPTVTVLTMKGCAPCAKLKEAFATSPDLKPFAAKIVDKDAERELCRSLGIRSFPTILVRDDKTVLFRKSGYDGNAKKLAAELTAALKKYKPAQGRSRK